MLEKITGNTLELIYKITDWMEERRRVRGMPMIRMPVSRGEPDDERYEWHIR